MDSAHPVQPDMVTVVIEHSPRPGAAAAYEVWLAKIIPVAARFPGHRGVQVLRPAEGRADKYTVTVRFDDLAAANAWLSSDARRALLDEVSPLLLREENVRTVTGIEFWFTAPAAADRRAPPFKQFLVALSVIYPLTLLVPWGLRPLLQPLSQGGWALLAHLVDVGTVVALMTWVIMPRYTRLVAAWLYR